MNRSELVDAVASRAAIPHRRAEEAVRFIFHLLFEAIAGGERVEIRGLGSFIVKSYDAYVGRNPRTGASIEVHSKRLPAFKAGKELKERVDGKRGGEKIAGPSAAPAPLGT